MNILRISKAATAFSFFGVGCAWLSLVQMPAIRLRGGTEREVTMRSQDAVRRGFTFFMDCVRFAGLVNYDPRSHRPEVPEGPFVLVANHPTLIDVIAVTASHERSVCIAKNSYFRSRALGPLLRQCAYVDGGDQGPAAIERNVEEGLARIREGYPLLVFAEGTRSPPGEMLRFGRLAFEIASRAGVPVVPVYVEANPPMLTKGLPWYRFPSEFVQYRLTQLPPVEVKPGRRGAREAMAEVERLLRKRVEAARGAPNPPQPESANLETAR